jgi:hypothetical protein
MKKGTGFLKLIFTNVKYLTGSFTWRCYFSFMGLPFLLLYIIFSLSWFCIPWSRDIISCIERTSEITPATWLQNEDLATTKTHIYTPWFHCHVLVICSNRRLNSQWDCPKLSLSWWPHPGIRVTVGGRKQPPLPGLISTPSSLYFTCSFLLLPLSHPLPHPICQLSKLNLQNISEINLPHSISVAIILGYATTILP